MRSPAARALFALGDASALRELRTVMQHARNDTEWKSAHEEQRLVDGMVALIDNEPARAESLLEPGGEPLCWSTYGVGATALVLCAEAQRRQGKLDAAASSLARLIRESDSTQRTGPALLAGPGILKTLASTSWGRRLSDADQAELSRWAAIASGDLTGGVESINSSELPAGLSEREAEVLDLITKGHSNKLIARDLSLSLFTVKRHVANILGKTELTSRTELATWWLGQQKSH